MRARPLVTAGALAALALAAGCSYSITNISQERPPETPVRAKAKLPLRALCDDEGVARRLEEAGLFERVSVLAPGTAVPAAEADVLVGLNLVSIDYPWPGPFFDTVNIVMLHIFFLPIGIVLDAIPSWALSPDVRMGYELSATDPGGGTSARYEATAQLRVEADFLGRAKMRGRFVDLVGEFGTRCHDHAAAVLASRVAADEQMHARLAPASRASELSACLLLWVPFAKDGTVAVAGELGGRWTSVPSTASSRVFPRSQGPTWGSGAKTLTMTEEGRLRTESMRFAGAGLQYRMTYDGATGRFGASPQAAVFPLAEPYLVSVHPLAAGGAGPAHPALAPLSREALVRARSRGALYLKQPGSLDGKPCWWVVAPAWDEGARGPPASALVAELYEGVPDAGAAPLEVVVVARRGPDGSWAAKRPYLRTRDTLTAVTAAIEGGRAVRVEAQRIEEPPLEDFLIAKESLTAEARWRNRALLVAKTRTVPKLLDERKTSELEALAIRIEQLVLDLNRDSELLKDQAQKVLAHHGGQAPPGAGADALRDLSLAYQERIEILKPILAAVKEEVANRRR